MVTRRLWWAAAGALLVLGACDGPRVGTDSGPDGDGGVCEGLTLCTTAGTSCDGDSLVTCAANADGCLVQTTTPCGAGQICDTSGATAQCVDDPCAAIPAAQRCTAEGRSCDGDTLAICAMNTDGCLVLEETNCAASPGGVCDESGAMPMCVLPLDPCDGIADACTTEGTSCDGTNLVTCAPDAFGCLVETSADCASRAGGTCDDTATAACTFTGDPCEGVTQCAAEGVSCDGPELVRCAEDAFGCLVETRTDCTDTMFGFCDADGAPVACSTAAVDPCMGETECGTEPTRACSADGTTVEACAPNAFGCFVDQSTTCESSEVCSDASGTAMCVDVCSLVDTCPSASYCDGSELVTCEADSNGCLVETDRTECAATEICDPAGTAACVTTMCPEAVPGFLNCSSGTVSGDTAMGSDVNDGRYGGGDCGNSSSWDGMEQFWRFRNDDATRMEVRIVATRGASDEDFDLFVIDGANACSSSTQNCIAGSMGSTDTETVTFVAEPGQMAHVVYDLWSSATATTDYTLTIDCTPIVCGDGLIGPSEGCDDGNTIPGDGCSDTCTTEPTYGCGGEPSICYVAGANGMCDTAAVITGNTVRNGERLTDGGARPAGTGCGGGSGNAVLYYAVTVPANTRVDVTTDSSTDLVLFTQDACSESDCTYATDYPESLSLSNSGTEAITRIVGVRGYSSTTGTFDINFTYATMAANGGCAAATPLGAGITGADLTEGGSQPTGTGCSAGTGPVLYYSVTVPANSATTVTATPTGTSWDLTLRSLADCSGTCTATRDSGGDGTAEQIVVANPSGEPVTQLVAVGGWTSTVGTFDLSSTTIALASNATCGGARVVTADATFTGESSALGGPRPQGTGCGTSSGNSALYYAVTIPAMSQLSVTTTGDFDRVLLVQDACDATTCEFRTDSSPESWSFSNMTSSPVTKYVSVHNYGGSDIGTFEIEFSYVTYAENAFCDGATPLTAAGIVGDDLSSGGPRPTGTGCSAGTGPVRYYSVTVPANNSTTVTATPTGTPSWDLTLRALADCSGTCTATRDSGIAGVGEMIVLTNTSAEPVTQLVAVGGWTAAVGTFDLSAINAPVAANASCATATPLGSGVTGVNLAGGGPRPTGASCGSSAGPVLYYSVDVPAHSATTVTGTPTGVPWDLTLRSLDDCSGDCTANVNSSTGGAETLTLVNDTDSPVTRLVAVGANSTLSYGLFDLSSTTIAVETNLTCATATAVTADVTYAAVNTLGGSTSGSCTPLGGPALWYDVSVPAGQRLTVTAVGAGDVLLKLRDTCATTSCTTRNATGTGGTEVLWVDNPGTEPISRLISVNALTGTGTFDLTFEYGPVPYTVAPITAACVTTGTWTTPTRSSSSGNDSTTPITALPFAFTYYGEAVTHYSTNDNGMAQLWSSSSGSPSTAWTNARLPSTSTPNGVVAAFWDDLYLGAAYDHRVQTVGTAGSQVLVIEWADALAGSGGQPLTFQAHFHEGTNVIEFHYCSVGTGDPASGSSATIGIENLTGTDGLTVSHDTAGAVATGGGYRFTPN